MLQARRAKAAELARMAAHCPGNLGGLRDRTLLLLAAAGLDREALLRLDREAVCTTDEGPRMGDLSFSSVPRPGAPASLRQRSSRPF